MKLFYTEAKDRNYLDNGIMEIHQFLPWTSSI